MLVFALISILFGQVLLGFMTPGAWLVTSVILVSKSVNMHVFG